MSNMPVVNTNTAALQDMFKQSQVEETAGGGLSFLKFDSKRLGLFLFGAAGEDVTDELIAIDVSTIKHGQIQWHKKKAARRMVPVNAPMPEAFEPIEYIGSDGKAAVDESSEGRSFEGQFVDGTRFLYEVSTFGGRKAMDAVISQLTARARAGNPFFFPHVKLESNSYNHSQWGLVYEPVLTVVAWYDGEGNLEPAEAAQLAAPAEAAPAKKTPPKRRTAQAAEPEHPAQEADETATAESDETAESASEEAGQQDAPPPRRRRRAAA